MPHLDSNLGPSQWSIEFKKTFIWFKSKTRTLQSLLYTDFLRTALLTIFLMTHFAPPPLALMRKAAEKERKIGLLGCQLLSDAIALVGVDHLPICHK